MAWEASRFIAAIIAAIFLLLFSRQWASAKRWHDFSFLQGLAFLAWGTGHLFGMKPELHMQILADILQFFFCLFLLLAFHAFPLAPHLYYERWKTVLDSILIAATFGTCMLVQHYYSAMSGIFSLLPLCQASIVILGTAFTLLLANYSHDDKPNCSNALLAGTMMFLVLDAIEHWLPQLPLFVATALDLLLILGISFLIHRRMQKLQVQEETHYLYEKLQLTFYDENMLKILFALFALPLITIRNLPLLYMGGMGLVLLILTFRLYKTRKSNQGLMRELFFISHQLEKLFAENMKQIHRKNEQLSRYLAQKQSYETLLLISNELNLRKINYETLQQIIEELVEKWFDGINELVYLRLSLQSEEGHDYFVVERGSFKGASKQSTMHERLIVQDETDTPLAPRYVSVTAVTTEAHGNDSEPNESEHSFVKLLAVNVRGFVLRCLYDQQSLEWRLMEQEMELASRIQFSLIPKERLVLPGLQAKAVYLPYTYVGGDYVDYVVIDDRYSCFLVADVAGHGIPSSLLTTEIRSCFRAVIESYRSPEDILERINRLLFEDLCSTRSYVTMFVAVYDNAQQVLRTSRAGHPQPLYLSSTRQEVLPCKSGVGLGLVREARYQADEWPIEENFVLLIYTDGLTELGRKEGPREVYQWIGHFGQVILRDENVVTDRIEAIEQDIWQSLRQKQQEDDISVLIIDVYRDDSA